MTQRLKPDEWSRQCPDCSRRLTVPMELHVECMEARHWASQTWKACNHCGLVNGRHAIACPSRSARGESR